MIVTGAITVIQSFNFTTSKVALRIVIAYLDEGVINVGDTFDNMDCTVTGIAAQDEYTGFGAAMSKNWAFLCTGKDIYTIRPKDKMTVTRNLDIKN